MEQILPATDFQPLNLWNTNSTTSMDLMLYMSLLQQVPLKAKICLATLSVISAKMRNILE